LKTNCRVHGFWRDRHKTCRSWMAFVTHVPHRPGGWPQSVVPKRGQAERPGAVRLFPISPMFPFSAGHALGRNCESLLEIVTEEMGTRGLRVGVAIGSYQKKNACNPQSPNPLPRSDSAGADDAFDTRSGHDDHAGRTGDVSLAETGRRAVAIMPMSCACAGKRGSPVHGCGRAGHFSRTMWAQRKFAISIAMSAILLA